MGRLSHMMAFLLCPATGEVWLNYLHDSSCLRNLLFHRYSVWAI